MSDDALIFAKGFLHGWNEGLIRIHAPHVGLSG
jgi:hypothetical protein